MENMSRRNLIRLLFVLLIIATVSFIFIQSMIPPEDSEEQSGAVSEIIGEIIPPETPVGGYVQTNIRKIAHFVEFAVLGAEVATFVVLFIKKIHYALASFLFAFVVAFFDETIQIFSGRGPQITDVWLDLFGFASTAAIIYTVCFIIYFVGNKRKQ